MKTPGGDKVTCIYKEKKIRNATWTLTLLESGKKAIFMNSKLQRIFKDYDEAMNMFEIYTTK